MNDPADLPNFGLTQIPETTFRTLYAMPCRTTDAITTKPAEAVRKLPDDEKLKYIARSDQLWNKLKDYATQVWSDVLTRTCGLPENLKPATVHPFPPVEEQKYSASLFHAGLHLLSLHARRSVGVTCEFSIQDEVTFILNHIVAPAIQVCSLSCILWCDADFYIVVRRCATIAMLMLMKSQTIPTRTRPPVAAT